MTYRFSLATCCPGPWQDAVYDAFARGVSLESVAGFFCCSIADAAEAVAMVAKSNRRTRTARIDEPDDGA